MGQGVVQKLQSNDPTTSLSYPSRNEGRPRRAYNELSVHAPRYGRRRDTNHVHYAGHGYGSSNRHARSSLSDQVRRDFCSFIV